MKKQILILIGMVLLIGIIIAGGELTKTNSTIDISADKLSALSTVGITKIEVKANPIVCDDKECWSWVSQGNLINQEFRIDKSYCTKYIIENETSSCLTYKDYTLVELTKARDNFIKAKVETYANSIIPKATTKLDDGGLITNS